MKMKTLRFARECVYIYLLKRRPDANTCILHGENTNAQRERESVGEITPFLCESSSLNVRHTFDTFSRENVRERRKSEQTKLRGGKAERADARKRIEGRVTTRSLQNVNAAIPRWEPSGPGKRRLPVGPFRRVRDVQGDVFEVFTGTTHMFSRSMCTRDGITLSLILNSSSFTRSK